ncbi:hypothetical protein RMSM_06366 [Rhodopirellula maiorica SM1]|uniref:Uncharacterized protein n=1 Tax=Rhodopirellula maiorica SM1 TaxID=1265738 RepID=M5RBF3_9BACT|nr:hypothetical protein RMSM_06366 [Rhodopirellula maiorica SM1]
MTSTLSNRKPVNPYKPPAEEINEEAPVGEPYRDRLRTKPRRSFSVAVFGTLFFAGPYNSIAPVRTVTCAIAFGLVAVWGERIYPRNY